MFSPAKRSWLLTAAAFAAVTVLVACGKEEPKPAPKAPRAPTAKSARCCSLRQPAQGRVGVRRPVDDAGWTFAHDQGRKAVEAEFGDKVKTTFVEKMPERSMPSM